MNHQYMKDAKQMWKCQSTIDIIEKTNILTWVQTKDKGVSALFTQEPGYASK